METPPVSPPAEVLQSSRVPRYYSPDRPNADVKALKARIAGAKQVIAEINAGDCPIGLRIARQPGMEDTLVVAEDIAQKSDSKVKDMAKPGQVPQNFAYLGESSILDALPDGRGISALLSFLPSNKRETLAWLPDTIAETLKRNPAAYVAVVTEIVNGHAGSELYHLFQTLPPALREKYGGGLRMTKAEFEASEIESIFGQTPTTQMLHKYGARYALLEINANRAEEFIPAFRDPSVHAKLIERRQPITTPAYATA